MTQYAARTLENLTTIKAVSMRYIDVDGVEPQKRFPIKLQTPPGEKGSFVKETLFKAFATSLMAYDENLDEFAQVANDIFTLDNSGKQSIAIVDGWESKRRVFILELSVTRPSHSYKEVIIGFTDHEGAVHYPQISRVPGRNDIIFTTAQHPSLNKIDVSGLACRATIPDELGLDNFIDTRTLVTNFTGSSVYGLSIQNYASEWCRDALISRAMEDSDDFRHNQSLGASGINNTTRQSTLLAALYKAGTLFGGPVSFTLPQLTNVVDCTALQETMVIDKQQSQAVDGARRISMTNSPVTAVLVKRIINILQAYTISLKKDTWRLVVRNALRHRDCVGIESDAYYTTDIVEKVRQQLEVVSKDFRMDIIDITVDYRLAGNSYVYVKYDSGVDYFVIPTYAIGLASPLVTEDEEAFNDLAKLFRVSTMAGVK